MSPGGDANEASLRVFFALWPDEATRERTFEATAPARRIGGGRPVPAHNLHLTMAFLGSIAPGALREIETLDLGGDAFDLCLDRIGFWPRTRIVWLGTKKAPPALIDLFDRLWNSLKGFGFARDKHPFRPHVTVARKAGPPGPALLPDPVHWRVNDVVLMHSRGGGRGVVYKALKRWPLDGLSR